ncbi:MAG: aminotransferase class V-fold PLP-dependent enzyme [Bryobacteraceae bacterium]
MESSYRHLFPRAGQVTYLDTAAEGLPAPGAEQALDDYHRDKATGTPGRRRFFAVERSCRESLARLLGSTPDDVTLVSNATEALAILANSLPLQAGDEIVINDLEFPSNVLAWLRLREAGVRVRVVESAHGAIPLDAFAAAINARTRLVTISQVSYKTGAQYPYLPQLAELAHRAGAVFCVDATQALGRVPVSLQGVDYLVASTYKWLLGVHGLGVLYCAPELRARLTPSSLGWYSVDGVFGPNRFEAYTLKPDASRFSGGMPNFPSIYVLKQSVDFLLTADVAACDARLKPAVAKLRQGIANLGLSLLTPEDPAFASGIVAFSHSKPEELGGALEQEGVVTWYGDGRVRASAHLYNDESDIDRYLATLASLVAKPELSHV